AFKTPAWLHATTSQLKVASGSSCFPPNPGLAPPALAHDNRLFRFRWARPNDCLPDRLRVGAGERAARTGSLYPSQRKATMMPDADVTVEYRIYVGAGHPPATAERSSVGPWRSVAPIESDGGHLDDADGIPGPGLSALTTGGKVCLLERKRWFHG